MQTWKKNTKYKSSNLGKCLDEEYLLEFSAKKLEYPKKI